MQSEALEAVARRETPDLVALRRSSLIVKPGWALPSATQTRLPSGLALQHVELVSPKATFPPSLLAEANQFRNGYVYEIDPRFERDGAIPPWAVLRGWKIDDTGFPTGEVIDNPSAHKRTVIAVVEQLLAEVAVLHQEGPEFELFVSPQTTFNDESIPLDVAMAIVGDRVLSIGFWPAGRRDFDGGFAYRYQRNTRSKQ